MKILCRSLTLVIILLSYIISYSQKKDSTATIIAERSGRIYNSDSNRFIRFSLCADIIYTDTLHYFTMLSGCERNVHLLLGKYSLNNDSIVIYPYQFKNENPFVRIYRRLSVQPIQTIKFLSANYQELKGQDSSWIIRAFKRKKEVFFNFSETGIVKLERGKFDGIELMQLSKIYGGPVVKFLDRHYDYTIIVNLPLEPLIRFIVDAYPVSGRAVIQNGFLDFNAQRESDKFSIIKDSRKPNLN